MYTYSFRLYPSQILAKRNFLTLLGPKSSKEVVTFKFCKKREIENVHRIAFFLLAGKHPCWSASNHCIVVLVGPDHL